MRLPQVDELVRQLQEGGVAPVIAAPDEEDGRGEPDARDEYGGIRILWGDDHPQNNATYARHLEDHGADVLVAVNGREAEHFLRSVPGDLLISDVARGTDRDAGFSDLQGRRERGLFDGPVVFFAGRVTPARQQRCRELGARITAGGATLMQYIDAAVADIRQHRA
jgi:CheY-like chemotaxis protein